MAYEYIDYETEESVGRVTIDRPDQLNAISVDTWEELQDALERLDDNEDVRSIVLAGRGNTFSTGDDINDILGLEVSAEVKSYIETVREGSSTVELISTPVIAKVDGRAFGVGCELAGIADITLATPDSTFCLAEPRIGVSALNGLYRFPDLIGLKAARDLALTARVIDAEEACDIGLVTEVVPGDDIEDVVRERTEQIANNAPLAVELSKEMMNSRRQGVNDAENVCSYLCMTDDREEGTGAFIEDRTPEWERR